MKKAFIIGGVAFVAILILYFLVKSVSTRASVAYNNMVPLKASGVSSQTPNSPLTAAAGAFTGVVTGFALKKLTSWLSEDGTTDDPISDDALLNPSFT
jgi:hypothetical protein